MAGRADLYREFAERFHAGKRVRRATATQLADAEAALCILWPESYRQFAMACGALYTPALLDLVVEHKPSFGEVQQFLTPKQSVTDTRRWRLVPAAGWRLSPAIARAASLHSDDFR